MKQFVQRNRNSLALVAGCLLLLSAAVYLPFVGKISYTHDDWYLMYDAHVAGPQFFHEVYSGDRPARAFVLGPAYALFGDSPLGYNLTGYAFRLLAGLALFWILDLLWPHRRSVSLSAALLFVIYPGFLSQTNPIDYQSQLLSLCLAMISIALTVKALLTAKPLLRIGLMVTSVLLGWLYLGLVEYHMGLEILRLMVILLVLYRQKVTGIKSWLREIVKLWLPYLSIPVGFLIWRTFLFQVERRATDINYQIGEFIASPLYKGLSWSVALLQDTFKVILLAWVVPFHDMVLQLRLRDMLLALGIAIAAAAVLALVLSFIRRQEQEQESLSNWKTEMLVVGGIAAVGGLLPIIIANRQADFGDYSRYTLASSAGSAMVITALIAFLASARMRLAALLLLVGMAAMTHFANGVHAAQDTQTIDNFWWQVSWRVPQFKDGTTLVASYPGQTGISEDYFVWGPAGLIYSPQKQSTSPLTIRVPAAILTQDITLQILAGRGHLDSVRRGNASEQDYSNVLVLAQAAPDGCVRVIDGSQPELSSSDAQSILLVAPRSKIQNVLLTADHPQPPAAVFGSEPPHGWCYYYEKASLAAQSGDWSTVVKLGDEAVSRGYHPADRVEWLPFLKAYVILGQREQIHPLVSILGADPYLKLEACQILSAAARTADLDMQTYIKESFCQ